MRKKKVGIKEIAKHAGVSPGTVDRVLHERGNVSEKSKEKILKAIEELDYKPNVMASILASNKYYRFATFLPDPSEDEFWEQPDAGVNAAAAYISDYHTQVDKFFFSDGKHREFLRKGCEILTENYNGFLFSPSFTNESYELLKLCEERNIPYVQINNFLNQDDPGFISYIGQDSYGSGLLAGKLLNFGLQEGQDALIIHLENIVGNADHLVKKEKGFRDFFKNHPARKINVVQASFGDIEDKEALMCFLESLKAKYSNIGGIFISTSRIHAIMESLETVFDMQKIKTVAFDLIESNLRLLENEQVDFLINQNPQKQGYLGLISLFQHVVIKNPQSKLQLLPLDIVMKENYGYYSGKKIEMLVL